MNFALFNWIVLLARLAIARPKEEPQQKTQDGQQHDDDDPDQFFLVGHRALKNIEDGPNVPGEYQQANEAVVSKVHHFKFPSLVTQVVNA